MTAILVLGAGPAALVSAMLLKRMGHEVQVIGRIRRHSAMEGASPRVIEGLNRLQCRHALALLGQRWQRVASWAGEYREINGEYVIDRRQLDAALLEDLLDAGVSFVDGRVMQVHKSPEGWRVLAELSSGEPVEHEAQFLVEARGRAAPKSAPDVFSGPMGVAMTGYFKGRPFEQSLTVTEPFDQGWAWATADTQGRCSVQLVVDHAHPGLQGSKSLAALHAQLYQRLQLIPERLGDLLAEGEISSRGIQPTLRANLVDSSQLRVGDAAYSCDPLSGHGMYEAVSAAFAAAPTINTLLRRPEHTELPSRFYRERAQTLFHQRFNTAVEFYQNEPRWLEQPFWANRRNQTTTVVSHAGEQAGSRVESTAVVEDGFIVESKVLVCADHPRGVRFVAGVDVVQLLETRRKLSDEPSVGQLAQLLQAHPERVAAALGWLRQIPGVAL
ncbi:lycopene cyclase family protein [Ectopseudomonas mendocina]|uniref:Lycopene cyclase family protein n=1 Tax=Ectopseudomonas mendocina TaxID=300 RepID=A0ABZ2RIA0_ECTME